MLIEQRDVRQIDGELSRRLFWDDTLDLAVWIHPSGEVEGFQVSYDPDGNPRTLTWMRAKGFTHARVDYGNDDVDFNRAPVLLPCTQLQPAVLRAKFLAVADALPAFIRERVDERLRELAHL